jgi:hypothetical protein
LISTARLVAWVNDSDAPAAILEAIERGVVASLERMSGYWLSASEARTEVLDGPTYRTPALDGATPETKTLYLRVLPSALTSVKFWDSDDWGDAETLTDFQLAEGGPALERGAIYYPNGSWPTEPRAVQVVYTFGYAEDAFPDDADTLVLRMVQWKYLQQDSGYAASERHPDMGITRQSWEAAGLQDELDDFLPGGWS